MTVNRIISLVVYPFEVMVSMNQSDKSFIKSVKSYGITDISDSIFKLDENNLCRARSIMYSSGKSILRLNFTPKYNEPLRIGLLHHEIFHIVHFIMDDINTPLTESTSEPYAYLVQHLTTEIYKILNENTKKNRRPSK